MDNLHIFVKTLSSFTKLILGLNSDELRSLEFPRTPSASRPECFTLYDCFDTFTEVEHIQGENAWFNEKTQQKEDIRKNITFWSFPNILVITLKRFSPDGQSKRNGLIDFPINGLDLSKYVSGYNARTYVYDLYAVCNHIGGVQGGHYTAFAKRTDGSWNHFNDTHVEKMLNPQDVVTPMAYCLFYRKKNDAI